MSQNSECGFTSQVRNENEINEYIIYFTGVFCCSITIKSNVGSDVYDITPFSVGPRQVDRFNQKSNLST